METQTNPSPEPPKESALKVAGAFIWDLVKILVIALIIIVPFRMFVAEPFVVSGSSMEPNFHNHDYLIVDRLSYLTGSPKRGDVIVLLYPKDTTQFFIKRIIGLPGDTVTIQNGYVTITGSEYPNGFRLPESYLPNQEETFGSAAPVHLGSDEYFVLGDNRTASSDSRVWGILPRNDIVGRVWARVYPFSTAEFFHTPTY
jgi:signal peptidase I